MIGKEDQYCLNHFYQLIKKLSDEELLEKSNHAKSDITNLEQILSVTQSKLRMLNEELAKRTSH